MPTCPIDLPANWSCVVIPLFNIPGMSISSSHLVGPGANLDYVNLAGVETDLVGVQLMGASLVGADLSGSNLTDASLFN